MKALWGLPLLVIAAAVCTAAAPAPMPTSVIAGLGQQVANDGRYYSVIAPFSIKSTWKGSTYSDSNGEYDRFRNGTRYFAIVSSQDPQNMDTTSLDKAVVSSLEQIGFTPKVALNIEISHMRVPVFRFSDSSGDYAEIVFVMAQRAWTFALFSDTGHIQHDLQDFLLATKSFRTN